MEHSANTHIYIYIQLYIYIYIYIYIQYVEWCLYVCNYIVYVHIFFKTIHMCLMQFIYVSNMFVPKNMRLLGGFPSHPRFKAFANDGSMSGLKNVSLIWGTGMGQN